MQTGEDDSSSSSRTLFPSVINWNHGGNEVYIVGAFNHWNKSIPLSKRCVAPPEPLPLNPCRILGLIIEP